MRDGSDACVHVSLPVEMEFVVLFLDSRCACFGNVTNNSWLAETGTPCSAHSGAGGFLFWGTRL